MSEYVGGDGTWNLLEPIQMQTREGDGGWAAIERALGTRVGGYHLLHNVA